MTEYTRPHVLAQPGQSHSYHTTDCRIVRASKHEATPVSTATVEWHELEECSFCSGEYVPSEVGGRRVIYND